MQDSSNSYVELTMRISKMIAAAGVATVLGIGAASAADLPLKAPPMPVVTVYNWTGCYVGGNIGGKWARTGDVVNIGPTAASPASRLDFGSATSDTFIG